MEEGVENRKQLFTSALDSSDQNLLSDLLIFTNDNDLSEIKQMLTLNDWILPRVCKLGFLNVLQSILDFPEVNKDAVYLKKTGLQYASEEGHVNVVVLLLSHGAHLKKSLWEEDSEFYLATLNGKQEIVDVLLSWEPDLAPDLTIRYCLMYAACLGGHLELVKKWFAPGTNVNETIAFTSDLNNCEQKYPLFAACQGEHLDVAKFLIKEAGSSITRDICQHFPEFTIKLVRSMFLFSNTMDVQEFYMAKHEIEYILPDWFVRDEGGDDEERDMFETLIDLKENKLKMLPDGVLWTLSELVSLDASYNPLRMIPDAVDPGLLAVNRLKTLVLAHCRLESLSSYVFTLPSLELLNLSHNRLTTLGTEEDWKCRRLQSLDISHNLLTSIPSGIRICIGMTTLKANNNHIMVTCPPWQCPMKFLDLSHNKLKAFAPNADQFWNQTLKQLYLQSNEITEICESIVKMRVLTHMDMSSNKIRHMPPINIWCCPLAFINLNDNLLGKIQPRTILQKKISLNQDSAPNVEFPMLCLAPTLMELFLANNEFTAVPLGISGMEKLLVLDLGGNTKIKELPIELGKLKRLLRLKLNGITVNDKELQGLISSLDDETRNVYAGDIIHYLEMKRRDCIHPDILKVVVLGCENANGHCIVQKLVNGKEMCAHIQENLTITHMTPKQKKSLTLEIWEIPNIKKVTSAILPCFLTLNSLYIIVHDVSSCGADLHSLSEKILSIQACVLRPKIIVACTYSKSMEKSLRERLESEILKSASGFRKAKFVSITLGARDNVDPLQQEIMFAWSTMKDAVYEKEVKLQKRQVPKTFLEVASTAKKIPKNICRMEEFLQDVGCSRKDLEDGIDHNLKLHEFLLQVGAMLHYNILLGELSDCVILNPTWLFKVLAKLLKSLMKYKSIKITQLPVKDVRDIVQDELPQRNYDYFPAFLKLLEVFNIGMRMTTKANKNDEVLLVPSLLPKQPPQIQLDTHRDAIKAARLYCLPAISPALWSHIISQLILAFERFSSSKWKLGEQKSNSGVAIDRTKSFRIGCATSLKGLHILNKNIQYWRTGIMMQYDQGHVVVEQVICISDDEISEPGILVTVQTTGSPNADSDGEQNNDNLKKLSIMGIVRDELEEILELFNPKFRDPSEAYMREIYALCPFCHNIKPGSGCVNLKQIHFRVRDCAQMCLSRDAMICTKGPTLLAHLVPEFLFLELPPELHLSAKDVQLSDVKLGHGMAGAVTKGVYKGKDVAVKVFHDSTVRSQSQCEYGSLYPNVGRLDIESGATRQEQDAMETRQIKISNAFSEVRREVGVLSKLKHEYIVTFIGLCIRPMLLLIMELAPLGSLRNELDKRTRDIFHELAHSDTMISQMIFSKDLTYKIVFQVGSGLTYLHKNNIIYRDLKPDNILVFSLSADDRVNVKLSDYGISKFATLQGLTGIFGTVGYIAPEVISKQLYTEKVDIYSYAIVMLEVLTGLPPLEQLHKPGWFQTSSSESVPLHVQGRKVSCNFPYLERLMEECWDISMDNRPSAENIVKRMKVDQFIFLRDCLWQKKTSHEDLEITCIYTCQTGGRWNIWISESGISNRRYFSVYDVESSSFGIHRKECHGPQVTDMTKVGSRIWVICKELKHLQVIVRGTSNNFDIYQGVNLDASATKILNHVFGTSEESESSILVGLENGSVAAYHFNTSQRKSMTIITNIELHSNFAVQKMCSVNPKLVAVACGVNIYLLQVELPEHQPVGRGKERKSVAIPEFINCGSVSLASIVGVHNPIVSMVPEGNAVWCSLENSACVVKVDVDCKKIVMVVKLSWEPVHDTVMLEEMAGGSDTRFRSESPDSMTGLRNQASGSCSNEQEARRYSGSGSEDPRRDNYQGTDEGGKPPMVPPRVYPEADEGGKPPVVPPRVFSNRKPPPVPRRGFTQDIAINATSLERSADVLIVGTSCGGIILLPLCYNHDSETSGSLPMLPFQLPVLRHCGKKKEPGTRSRSFTTGSESQAVNSNGAIVALACTSDKIVSLHSAQNLILRDRCRNEKPPNVKKRMGSVFNIGSMSTEEESPHPSTSDKSFLRPHSAVSPPPAVAESSRPHSCEVADIAIWDNISRARLKAVRSYGHDSVKCSGWCCHAPDRSF